VVRAWRENAQNLEGYYRMSDQPHYRESTSEPTGVKAMHEMMTKPSPPMADPATVALNLCGRIYFNAKSKVLIGDGSPEAIIAIMQEARERTRKEVVIAKIRDGAVKSYDQMIASLGAG
jgi:hypothetical protein